MGTAPEVSSSQLEENLWIEIVRTVESLYGDLAQTQAEAEKRNEELHQAKAFTDNIIRSMVSSLVVADHNSVITMANDACCRLLGYAREELLGKPLDTIFRDGASGLVRPGSGPWWTRLGAAGSATDLEAALVTKEGGRIPVGLNVSLMRSPGGDMIGMVLVATDMRQMKRLLDEARAAAAAEREQAAERAKAYRELKALQARLIQSEKMSSLGRLAASVAHEINNPLGGIIVYSHLLLEGTREDFPGRANLEKIVREAIRCRDIVRGLLDFARPEPGTRRAVDLNAIVRTTYDLVKGQSIFGGVQVKFDLSPAPLEVSCDPSQLEQAFTNILVNAAEAIGGPGTISIRSWYEDGPQTAAVSFTDTGCGMSPENLERIFEPFFTTRREGHGTGLGLAIVYRIIERHLGTIKVDSVPGKGTTFTVRLPGKGSKGA